MAGPLVALVIFFVVFVAITLRVLRARPEQFAGEAMLPLSDGNEAQRPTSETRGIVDEEAS